MAYTVLARRYRSRTFDEVIGQEPIATTLASAIRAGRIHHGYLFTGPRGTGKTSMARILAKSLNCLRAPGPTVHPCLECDACRLIAEGEDLDVIEIDAASNTGVDHIRDLRASAAYRPARSRFKIYIIDEVHMLSAGAFNALLKTLEEPPEHVKFILATTELHKVPATIQSRCQRFVFQNIGVEEIARRLGEIVREEGATAEPAVLRRIARLAGGSMRDGLSILDQLLSVSPERLTSQVLDQLIPPPQDEQTVALLRSIAEGRVAEVLQRAAGILDGGRSADQFCTDLVEVLRTLMHVRVCGPDSPAVDIPGGAREAYVELSGCFEVSQYVQMIALLEELRRQVRFSGAGRALVDAAMVRLAHLRAWAPIEQIIASLSPGPPRGALPGQPVPPAPGGAEKKKKPVGGDDPITARAAAAGDSQPPGLTAGAARPAPERADPRGRTEGGASRAARSDSAIEAWPEAGRRPAGPEQRAGALEDPLVRQVMQVFDAMIVSVERQPLASGSGDEGH